MTRTVRKVSFILLAAALLGIAAAQFTSCEKFVLPEVELQADTLVFPAAGGSKSVLITTNVITTAEPLFNDQSWVTTDPAWFDETSNVVVTVKSNAGSAERSTSIPIKSEAIVKSLVVIQKGQ